MNHQQPATQSHDFKIGHVWENKMTHYRGMSLTQGLLTNCASTAHIHTHTELQAIMQHTIYNKQVFQSSGGKDWYTNCDIRLRLTAHTYTLACTNCGLINSMHGILEYTQAEHYHSKPRARARVGVRVGLGLGTSQARHNLRAGTKLSRNNNASLYKAVHISSLHTQSSEHLLAFT